LTTLVIAGGVPPDALAWFTVTVCPAIVSVAVRGSAPLLASAANATEPFPLTAVTDAIFSHDALEAAVHAQPAPAVTVTLPVPPATGSETAFDETAYVQVEPPPKTTNPPENTAASVPFTTAMAMGTFIADGARSTVNRSGTTPFTAAAGWVWRLAGRNAAPGPRSRIWLAVAEASPLPHRSRSSARPPGEPFTPLVI
jgi:hypothetical protein